MLEHIADLARNKPFAALNAAERLMVLAEMSESEYQKLHRALSFFKHADADLAPPSGLKKDLLGRFAEAYTPSRRPAFAAFFYAPIPLWRAAATVLLAVCSMYFFMDKKTDAVAVAPVYQTLVRVDTVWKTEIRWRDRVVVQPVIQPAKARALAPEIPSPKVVLQERSVSENWSAPVIGMPIGDQPELLDFFTSAENVSENLKKK